MSDYQKPIIISNTIKGALNNHRDLIGTISVYRNILVEEFNKRGDNIYSNISKYCKNDKLVVEFRLLDKIISDLDEIIYSAVKCENEFIEEYSLDYPKFNIFTGDVTPIEIQLPDKEK